MVTALAREELQRAAIGRPTALTIGVFDGVHRGHQALLRRVLESARRDNLAAAAVTFHPHPRR
ncbi:MAG TPA: bifunctional riboflavin kinase/FAD synthetase, partial [Dehalococcoidia bacterium]|nr:bifunctional riboflavin kinase/FAD synthetase [Dehalococcoidia bacterium]